MSSISGVGASQSWQIQQSQTQAGGRPSGPPPGPPPGMQDAVESVAEEAGLDSTQISDLMAKLDEAAASARESGEGPESMRAALDSVLEEAGIDTESFHEQLSAMHGQRPGRGQRPGGDAFSGEGDTDTTSTDILEMLRDLPVGSLYDTEA